MERSWVSWKFTLFFLSDSTAVRPYACQNTRKLRVKGMPGTTSRTFYALYLVCMGLSWMKIFKNPGSPAGSAVYGFIRKIPEFAKFRDLS